MAQPVTAILSSQGELAAKARQFTNDTNEANLLVGKVMSRAFSSFRDEAADEVVLHSMRRDLDRMIDQREQPVVKAVDVQDADGLAIDAELRPIERRRLDARELRPRVDRAHRGDHAAHPAGARREARQANAVLAPP